MNSDLPEETSPVGYSRDHSIPLHVKKAQDLVPSQATNQQDIAPLATGSNPLASDLSYYPRFLQLQQQYKQLEHQYQQQAARQLQKQKQLLEENQELKHRMSEHVVEVQANQQLISDLRLKVEALRNMKEVDDEELRKLRDESVASKKQLVVLQESVSGLKLKEMKMAKELQALRNERRLCQDEMMFANSTSEKLSAMMLTTEELLHQNNELRETAEEAFGSEEELMRQILEKQHIIASFERKVAASMTLERELRTQVSTYKTRLSTLERAKKKSEYELEIELAEKQARIRELKEQFTIAVQAQAKTISIEMHQEQMKSLENSMQAKLQELKNHYHHFEPETMQTFERMQQLIQEKEHFQQDQVQRQEQFQAFYAKEMHDLCSEVQLLKQEIWHSHICSAPPIQGPVYIEDSIVEAQQPQNQIADMVHHQKLHQDIQECRKRLNSERTTCCQINTEYLKNVLLKFLTTSSKSEKEQLVRVLATILNFPPHEAQVAVSKVEERSGPLGQLVAYFNTASKKHSYSTLAVVEDDEQMNREY